MTTSAKFLRPGQPLGHKLVIYLIDPLLMGEQLSVDESLCRLLNAAGRSEIITFDKRHSCDLACLAFPADGDKQVTLTYRQLIEDILIGFFVLVDDFFYSFIDICYIYFVFRGIELGGYEATL